MAQDRKMPQKIDPVFKWLPTDIALILTEKRHPNTPLIVGELVAYYKSQPQGKQKEIEASAKTANNEVGKAFLAAITKR